MMECIKVRFYCLLLFFSLWLYLSLSGYTYINGILLFCLLTITNILLVVRSARQNNKLFFVVFSYSFFYVYVLRYSFIYQIPIAVYVDFISLEYAYESTLAFALFLIILFGFIRIERNTNIKTFRPKSSPLIFYLCYILSLVAAVKGKSGESILNAGAYMGGEVSTSSLNEYFFIFFVSAFYYCGICNFHKRLLYLLAFFYCAKNLLFGGRIETAMMGFCLLVLVFQYKYKIKTFVVGIISLFFLMTIWGNIRQNPTGFLAGDWGELLFSQNDVYMIVSQEGDVNYGSFRMVGLVEEGILSIEERLKALGYFFISIFIPYSKLPLSANLSAYLQSSYPSGGGGLISGYFYVYLSYFGVVLIAIWIARVLSKVAKSHENSIIYIYAIYVITTYPRWFAYNPIVLFKLTFWGVVFTSLINYLYHHLNDEKSKDIRCSCGVSSTNRTVER